MKLTIQEAIEDLESKHLIRNVYNDTSALPELQEDRRHEVYNESMKMAIAALTYLQAKKDEGFYELFK